MNTADVFSLCNALVLPAWLVLIFFPKKKWRNPVIYSFAVVLSGLYAYYVVSNLTDFDPNAFNSLDGVKQLFTSDLAVLTGWIHYLVFDLLIGNWILNLSIKNGLKHWVVVPCLLLCFMFGPVGYLVFMAVKVAKAKAIA